MKIFYFLIPLFMVNACKTPAETVVTSEKTTMKELKSSASDCPKEGTCKVELHKNKQLEIVDEGNGRMYSQIVEGKNLVVEYTYLKSAPEGIADGNYFETIQFQVPMDSNTLVKENSGLADVRMIFGKHGFRNSASYIVTDGKLSYQKSGKEVSFSLKFKVKETTHVVSNISERVTLD